jgi:hypothetical protein
MLDYRIGYDAVKGIIWKGQGLSAGADEGSIKPGLRKALLAHHQPAESDVNADNFLVATAGRYQQRASPAPNFQKFLRVVSLTSRG